MVEYLLVGMYMQCRHKGEKTVSFMKCILKSLKFTRQSSATSNARGFRYSGEIGNGKLRVVICIFYSKLDPPSDGLFYYVNVDIDFIKNHTTVTIF